MRHVRSLTRFGRREYVEHDHEAGFDLNAHDGPGRRRIRNKLPVSAVEHIVLDAVIDHRVHLHDAVQGRAGGLQKSLRFSKMRRASLVTVPCSPLCGLIATMPEQKISPPARIAGL
jgi:hypothetical protein